MGSFKKFEVSGVSKKEALLKLADFFAVSDEGTVKGEATAAYKKAKSNASSAWTESVENQFMADYLNAKKAIAGEAYVVTKESAVGNTRERPWTIDDIKSEGKRVKSKAFILRNPDTHEELGRVSSHTETATDGTKKIVRPTKQMAKEAMKKVWENGYTGKIEVELAEEVISGSSIVLKGAYTPSKSTKNGVYLVFGYVK